MRVAVCQLNSRDDRAANLAAAASLLERAAAAGADLAVLPGVRRLPRPGRRASPSRSRSTASSPTFFADAARRARACGCIAGSFHEAGPDAAHTYNTSLVFDRDGALAAHVPEDPPVRRRDPRPGLLPGVRDRSRPATETGGGRRRRRPGRPVDLLRPALPGAVPAARRSTARQVLRGAGRVHDCTPAGTTGRCCCGPGRSRTSATCVAAGQIGDHDPGRTCFGRSMVIDPWGTVVAQAPDGVGVTVADLDLDRLAEIRRELPSLANRRLLTRPASRGSCTPVAGRLQRSPNATVMPTMARAGDEQHGAASATVRAAPADAVADDQHQRPRQHADDELPERDEQLQQRVRARARRHAAILPGRGGGARRCDAVAVPRTVLQVEAGRNDRFAELYRAVRTDGVSLICVRGAGRVT